MAITKRTVNQLLGMKADIAAGVDRKVTEAEYNALKRAYNHFVALGEVPPPAVLQAARNLGIAK